MIIRKIISKIIRKERYDSDTFIKYLKSLGCEIGERSRFFGLRTTVVDITRPWLIKIGDDVQIAAGVTILTHDFSWSVLKRKYGDILGSSGKVVIGNNVFVGMNTTILKGVTIGNNVIIGACSLVCHDVPDNVVIAGNPAKVIMTIDEYYEKRKLKQISEAQELVHRYRIVYGKDPDESALDEFFFLYESGDGKLPNCYLKQMNNCGNFEESLTILKKIKKDYKSLDDFLKRI